MWAAADDFMFQLSKKEKIEVVANCDYLKNLKHSTVTPLVFTEHGALMAANILNSLRAVSSSLEADAAVNKQKNNL